MLRGYRLVKWRLFFIPQAKKDAKKIAKTDLQEKVQELLLILQEDPFKNPPAYKKLVGDLNGAYSRRINIHHRLIYQIIKNKRYVKIIRMWTHYE